MVGGEKMSKFSLSDKTFDRINFLFVLMITLIIIYPLVFVLSASISDPQAVNTGKLWLWPVDITFDGFARIFKKKPSGYGIEIQSIIPLSVCVSIYSSFCHAHMPYHAKNYWRRNSFYGLYCLQCYLTVD